MNKVLRLIVDRKFRFDILTSRNILFWMSDKQVLERKFKYVFNRDLDFRNPQTFNEKLQWLKLYDRKDIYTTMVDKYEVKQYVADRIGEEYIIPTLGVWDRFEDIDFDNLPNQFVLKCTHDSGGLVICHDKSKLDISSAKKKINKSLKKNYYFVGREWPYKNVKPRIMAEQYMQDGDKLNLPVYKIFNFNGEPKIIQVIQDDKTINETIDYFDIDWNRLDLRQNFPNSDSSLYKPQLLGEMIDIARKFSAGFPFLRTDLYIIGEKIYFSEFTFYSDSGLAIFNPTDWDKTLGTWIKLPSITE